MFVRNLQMSRLYFFRNRLLLALNFLVWTALAGMALYSLAHDDSGAKMLFGICMIQFYVLVVILCAAYEFFSQARMQNADECLVAVTHGRSVYSICLLFWQMIVAGLMQCFLLAAVLITSALNDGQDFLLGFIWKPFLINAVLPSVICILLAYLLANRVSRLPAYGLILLFLLLISPFAEDFVWRIKPRGFPIDQVFTILRWPMTILYQNSDYSFDPQTGFQTELPRIQVQLFWLILLLGLGPLTGCLPVRRRFRQGLFMITVLLAAAMLASSLQPASLYRINNRWDGVNIDFTYYNWGKADNSLQTMTDPGFQVTEYTLTVSLDRLLAVTADLAIESDAAQKEFPFTLYRGYRVRGACLVNGQKIGFAQDGDCLTLSLPEQTEQAIIRLSYEGSCNNLYSNNEGAMLPGYFPWFPMAGKRQVFLDSLADYGYNPYNRVAMAQFNLTVRGCPNIITNLSPAGAGQYSSVTDGLSLFAGQIFRSDDTLVQTLLPLEYSNSYTADDFITQMHAFFNQSLQILENIYGLDTTELRHKPIIHPSFVLGRSLPKNKLAVFSDHILISTEIVQVSDILKYYLARQKIKNDSALCDLFTVCISDTPEQCIDSMLRMLDLYEKNRQMMISLGLPAEGRQRELALREPLAAAVSQLDALKIVKEIYTYLQDADKPADDQLFLEQLVKGD